MNRTKVKISLVLNILIVIFTIFATIAMFTGFKFMHEYNVVLQSTKLGMLRFFTVQSNILMGIIALFFAGLEIKLLKGKIEEISTKAYVLKLMATTAVGLTFLVVFAYLGPITEYGIIAMIMNSNLFFHLITPLLSMICFAAFERTNKVKFKYTFWGIIPTFLYAIYYMINIFTHMENGQVSPVYDWYWFVQNGVWTAIIVIPLMFLITYLITLLLWRINKKKEQKNVF